MNNELKDPWRVHEADMKRYTFCTLTLEVFNVDAIESFSKVGHFFSVLYKKGVTLKPHKQKLFTCALGF